MRRVLGCMLLMLFVILGCAQPQMVPDEAFLKTWQGKQREDLIAALGPPTSERSSETGAIFLTWEGAQRHPGGLGRMGMGASYYTVCIREFEIDKAGRVVGAAQRGCH